MLNIVELQTARVTVDSLPIKVYTSVYEDAVKAGIFTGTLEEFLSQYVGSGGGQKGDKGDPGEPGVKGDQGEPGRDGKDGQDGQDGKSAYQIAVELGLTTDTEDDWIGSLKGDPGIDGGNDPAVLNRLSSLELRADSADASMSEIATLSQDLAAIKVSVDQIAAMDERLNEMAKAVSDGLIAQAQLAEFKQRLDTLEAAMGDKAAAADIVRLSGQLADAQAQIAALQDAVKDAAAAGVVVDLSNQVAVIQSQMTADRAALDALTAKVEDGAELAALSETVAQLSTRVDDATLAAAEISVIQAQIAALQAQVGNADNSVVTALSARVASLEVQVATMPKFKQWQSGYIARAEFVGTVGNNSLVTASFATPFTERPFVVATADVQDTAARFQSVQNVTITGFDISISYGPSLRGVSYIAFIPA